MRFYLIQLPHTESIFIHIITDILLMVQLITMFLQGIQDDCNGKSLHAHIVGDPFMLWSILSPWNAFLRQAMLQKCIRLEFIIPPHFAIFFKNQPVIDQSYLSKRKHHPSVKVYISQHTKSSLYELLVRGNTGYLKIFKGCVSFVASPEPKTQEQICKEWISLCLSLLHC